jgi:hypothetical protein
VWVGAFYWRSERDMTRCSQKTEPMKTRQSAADAELRPSPAQPAWALTADELDERIRSAVVAALEAHSAGRAPAPEYVSGAQMGHLLGISRSMMHKLRLEGCPAVKIGDGFRFSPIRVVAWLEARGDRS